MKYLIKYKWFLLAYIIYAAFIPLWLDEGLDLRHRDFWYGIIICYFAVPLIVYTVIFIIKNLFESTAKVPTVTNVESEKKVDKNSVPLLDFAKKHGQMKIFRHIDNIAGDSYILDCMFVDSGGKETHVCVANNIKDYTPIDIIKAKENMSVILMPSGKWCLCLNWETVDLCLK